MSLVVAPVGHVATANPFKGVFPSPTVYPEKEKIRASLRAAQEKRLPSLLSSLRKPKPVPDHLPIINDVSDAKNPLPEPFREQGRVQDFDVRP